MKLMLGKASTVAEASGCDWTKKACDLLAFNWLHEAAQKSPMLCQWPPVHVWAEAHASWCHRHAGG